MIVELLEEGIKRYHEKKEAEQARDMSATHPSALFGCLRLQAYEQRGTELEPPDVRSMSIWRDGDQFHKTSQEDLIALGYSKAEWMEIKVEDMYGIKGHADLIVDVNGELILLDFKSFGHEPDWFGNKKWKEMITNPPLKYKMQLIVYMGALRKQGYLIERGFLVFKRKCNGELAEYEVKWDEFLYDIAIDRARQLWQFKQNGTLPEREYDDPKTMPCAFCSARHICWEGGQ